MGGESGVRQSKEDTCEPALQQQGAYCKLIDAGDVKKYFEVGKNRWQELQSIEIYCSGTSVGMWVGRLSVFFLLQ